MGKWMIKNRTSSWQTERLKLFMYYPCCQIGSQWNSSVWESTKFPHGMTNFLSMLGSIPLIQSVWLRDHVATVVISLAHSAMTYWSCFAIHNKHLRHLKNMKLLLKHRIYTCIPVWKYLVGTIYQRWDLKLRGPLKGSPRLLDHNMVWWMRAVRAPRKKQPACPSFGISNIRRHLSPWNGP